MSGRIQVGTVDAVASVAQAIKSGPGAYYVESVGYLGVSTDLATYPMRVVRGAIVADRSPDSDGKRP